jgi:hypothetical protein
METNEDDKMGMQGIAIHIEMFLRKEYKIKRDGFDNIVHANFIRYKKGAFYYCMAMILIKFYSGSEDNSKMIDEFINSIDDIRELKLEEIKDKKADQIVKKFDKVYKKVQNG